MAIAKRSDVFHFSKLDDESIMYYQKETIKNDKWVKTKEKSKTIKIDDIINISDTTKEKFAHILRHLDDVWHFDKDRNPVTYDSVNEERPTINGEEFQEIADLINTEFSQPVLAITYEDEFVYDRNFFFQYITRKEINKLSILERLQLHHLLEHVGAEFKRLPVEEDCSIKFSYYHQ